MEIFGFAFSLFETALLVLFIFGMLIGTSLDRAGREEPKWVILGLGLAALLASTWSDWTFKSLGSYFMSAEFWHPALKYVGFGLAYSIVELFREVASARAKLAKEWNDLLSRYPAFRQLVLDSRAEGAAYNHEVHDQLQSLADSRVSSVIGLVHNTKDHTVEPVVNKVELADHMTAWTFFWPFYLLSFVLGDFVLQIFNIAAEMLAHISGKAIKAYFASIFKL